MLLDLLAVLLAFYYFNRYPAKVFDGDTGSLAVGAALGALAILGRIETVVVVALIPHIMNAFYGSERQLGDSTKDAKYVKDRSDS